MADIVVPIVLENLIKFGIYEANLLLGVKDQVHLLESDLRFIKVFLQKSAGKRSDPFLKELADQISDAALDCEDALDAYAARVISERRRNHLGNLVHCFGHARDLHGVSNQTSSIRNKIENIYKNQEKYGIGEADQPSVHDEEEAEQESLQRRRRNVEEQDVVGFEKDATTLINQLTNQSNLRLDVISIHGMGGLGKTTLARKIYKDSRVKRQFQFCAWISVSQEWQAKSLLLDLLKSFEQITKETSKKTAEDHKQITEETSKKTAEDHKQITEETSKKTAEDLKDELREQLKGKRYLVVMDDIWSTQVWEEVSGSFPDESNGSRILFTTRVRDVARHASPTTAAHELQSLDENESWELLQKKAFRGGEWQSLHPNLEEPGRELAKSCRGLPLSIVLLGGILATKEKSIRVWSRYVKNVNSHLTDEVGVDILKLSFNHLPRELKSCFLYVGLFPEDSEINVKDLIELWIAEGFIKSDRSTSIYDVAEDYMEKLIDRSMIQVARKRLDGGVKTCRIHDLLRDLCIAESRRDKFFDIFSIDDNVSFNTKSRRLSIQRHISAESFNCDLSSSSARSLLFFGAAYDFISKSVWKQIYKSTQFIRVLRLFKLRIKRIPSQIEELIFLRCLFIKQCNVCYISSSIWNFRYLETLHLEFAGKCSLPKGIWSVMKDLRYLYVAPYSLLLEPPRSLMGLFGTSEKFNGTFGNLQILSWLRVKPNTALVIDKFPNLRKLGLKFTKEIEVNEVEKLMASIGRLESLQSLKIRYYLMIRNRNEVGIRLNSFPSALTKFSWTSEEYFNWEIFKVLARQPHLRVLKIIAGTNHEPYKVRVVAGEFPQLQVLKLSLRIETWEMEKDAMPDLESLFLHDCDYLEYLPEDELLCRPNLQLVQVTGLVRGNLKNMLKDFKIKYPATPCKVDIS